MNILLFQPRFFSFLKTTGRLVFVFFIITFQYSCAPEIETLLYQSPKGRIALQTSAHFTVSPDHPHTLPESLLKKTLKGFSQIQEKGVLQELFFSSARAHPVFSSRQIDFLAPQLAQAFSRATPEEFIKFECPADSEESSSVEGTLSVFSPNILILSLKTPQKVRRILSKTSTSSANLQKTIRIEYANEEAVVPTKVAQQFMTFPQADSWIAIDYTASSSKNSLSEITLPTPPTGNDPEKEPPPDVEILQQQLQNLEKKIDEQAKEIERLQPAEPRKPLPHQR